jgi:purine-binding chemotaxis protein CheW
MAALTAAEKPKQFLTIRLGADDYGIALATVREILPVQTLTRVPGTPSWVRGVCNLRGTVLPVVDLAVRFGFGQTATPIRACCLVLELAIRGQTISVGVMAEAVSNVVGVKTADIEAAPAVGLALEAQYVLGLVRVNDRFIVLLDFHRIFATDELIELGEATGIVAAAAPLTAAPTPGPPVPPTMMATPPAPDLVADDSLSGVVDLAAEEGAIGFFK